MKRATVLFRKTCECCGNHCIVIGKVNTETSELYISTEASFEKASCYLIGSSSIRCLCGKMYRMINRYAWESKQWEQMSFDYPTYLFNTGQG